MKLTERIFLKILNNLILKRTKSFGDLRKHEEIRTGVSVKALVSLFIVVFSIIYDFFLFLFILFCAFPILASRKTVYSFNCLFCF